jgi:hypothetical protein
MAPLQIIAFILAFNLVCIGIGAFSLSFTFSPRNANPYESWQGLLFMGGLFNMCLTAVWGYYQLFCLIYNSLTFTLTVV